MKNPIKPTLTLEQTDEIVLAFLSDNDLWNNIDEAEDKEFLTDYHLDDGSTLRVSKVTGKVTHLHYAE